MLYGSSTPKEQATTKSITRAADPSENSYVIEAIQIHLL
jgi:hypothetical protein